MTGTHDTYHDLISP